MPARAQTFRIGRIHVTPHESSTQIRTGPGTAAPSRFQADVMLEIPAMHAVVNVMVGDGGLPVVEQLGMEPLPGTMLTSTTLRAVLLDPIVRAALKEASRPVVERPDVAAGAFQVDGDPDETHAWVSVPAGADDRVLQVARLYREALAAGSRSPAADAAAAVHISRAQVARYIRRARAGGLIPPVDQVIRKTPR